MALIISHQVRGQLLVLSKEKIITNDEIPRFSMEIIGQPGQTIVHSLAGVLNRHTKIKRANIDMPDHAAAVALEWSIVSFQFFRDFLCGIRQQIFCQLTDDTLLS